jgi:hypothetical protein
MRKPTYTVFDSVSQIYNWPFAAFNDEDAKRSFSTSILKELPERAQEFSLWHNGYYDDNTGMWEPTELVCIYRGSEIDKPNLKAVNNATQST